jgi:hypothetical protein
MGRTVTYNELLEKIDLQSPFIKDEAKKIKALHAVVKLHEPEQGCFDPTCYCPDNCKMCRSVYPCLTIRTIEKELA